MGWSMECKSVVARMVVVVMIATMVADGNCA